MIKPLKKAMTMTAFTADIFVEMKLLKWKNPNSFKRKIVIRNVATRNRNLVIKVRVFVTARKSGPFHLMVIIFDKC